MELTLRFWSFPLDLKQTIYPELVNRLLYPQSKTKHLITLKKIIGITLDQTHTNDLFNLFNI